MRAFIISWSLQERFIERLVIEDGTGIENYANLVRFLWMIYIKVWEIPNFACLRLELL